MLIDCVGNRKFEVCRNLEGEVTLQIWLKDEVLARPTLTIENAVKLRDELDRVIGEVKYGKTETRVDTDAEHRKVGE